MDIFSSTCLLIKPTAFVPFSSEEIDNNIVNRFERQVKDFPNKLAVKQAGVTYTYSDLNRTANQLANTILGIQGSYHGPIAFLLDHGVPQITAIFGILKSGNAYVALDSEFPRARLEYMLSDSMTPLLITNRENLKIAQEISTPEIKIINIDEIPDHVPQTNIGLDLHPDMMMGLYYTSGSTGDPKGCKLTHKNIMHNVMVLTNSRYYNPHDRQIFPMSASYAGSLNPIFCALLNGAGLYPYDVRKQGLQGLYEYLINERITILTFVPSTFRYLASSLQPTFSFPDVRLLTLGGETVLKVDIDLFKKFFTDDCCLINTLAGTETLSICSYAIFKNSKIPGLTIPVGYPLEGIDIQLIDENGLPVAIGEEGEIVIQSKYLSPGYWHRPELTKRIFQPVPDKEGTFEYRTGDLGRMDKDGCLYHLGRKDNRVKIRGYRVELAETNSILFESALIKDVFVNAHTDSLGGSHLIAYIVPAKKSDTLVKKLICELRDQLPSYMIPTDFVILNQIPKTPSGKVDLLALSKLETSHLNNEKPVIHPQNLVEKKLVQIWESLLKHHSIGIKDDFFELGGHSLLGLRLVAEIESQFGINLPFPVLVQNSTIEKLAPIIIYNKEKLQPWSHLIAIQPLGSKPPLFCVPPSAVTAMVFKDLAKHLGEDQPFYGLDYRGMEGEFKAHNSIPAMAKFNNERIKAVQPKGPYYIGGMCFGGLVAYEMAQQLLAEGEDVPFLGILDSTHAPNMGRPRAYTVFMFTHFINQKILRRRFPLGMAPLRESMRKFQADDEIGKRIYDVFTTHNYARMTYISNTYPGRIILFNTAGSRGEFSTQQWRRVISGKLEIVSIPGKHSGAREGLRDREQSFIHEPNVKILAQRLEECLEDNV